MDVKNLKKVQKLDAKKFPKESSICVSLFCWAISIWLFIVSHKTIYTQNNMILNVILNFCIIFIEKTEFFGKTWIQLL